MRILLAEDEESLRVTLAANLELHGHEVIEARDGREAMALLGQHQVDLVLSDIRMPRLGGVGLLAQVKNTFPGVPVVLMTAYTAEDQINEAIAGGVYTVLRKPFDLEAAMTTFALAADRALVLLVDDDRADASRLAESLRSVGLLAEAAVDAEAATRIVGSGRVNVCVMSLSHLAALRDLSPSISVIVATAETGDDLVRYVSDAGIFAVMRKPVDALELLHTVAKARGGPAAL